MSIFSRLAARLRTAGNVASIGGADEDAIRALAVSAPVLSLIDSELAACSPDQAHELGYGMGRRG